MFAESLKDVGDKDYSIDVLEHLHGLNSSNKKITQILAKTLIDSERLDIAINFLEYQYNANPKDKK